METKSERFETCIAAAVSIIWAAAICYIAHTFQPVDHAINRLGDIIHDGAIRDSVEAHQWTETHPKAEKSGK